MTEGANKATQGTNPFLVLGVDVSTSRYQNANNFRMTVNHCLVKCIALKTTKSHATAIKNIQKRPIKNLQMATYTCAIRSVDPSTIGN